MFISSTKTFHFLLISYIYKGQLQLMIAILLEVFISVMLELYINFKVRT